MTATQRRIAGVARGRRRRRGVTLVEVLIVIAIMALISGGVGVYVIAEWRKAQMKTVRINARALRSAAQLWRVDQPSADCPDVDQLKTAKTIDPSVEADDPWGQAYIVDCVGDDVAVGSSGPDAAAETDDDIWVGPHE